MCIPFSVDYWNLYQSVGAFSIFYLEKGLLLSFYDKCILCLVRKSVNPGELRGAWQQWFIKSEILCIPIFLSTITCQMHYQAVSSLWNSSVEIVFVCRSLLWNNMGVKAPEKISGIFFKAELHVKKLYNLRGKKKKSN